MKILMALPFPVMRAAFSIRAKGSMRSAKKQVRLSGRNRIRRISFLSGRVGITLP